MRKNKYPMLSVVIPTRERAITLKETLRTVVTQDYTNLEIIVSDNCSNDNTKEIVDGFNDSRIIYTTTSKRVGMASNWEHGLSLVTGDYVMFLGDDDGLLPDACSDIANLIVTCKPKAVIWQKADYCWPGAQSENQLIVNTGNLLYEIDSKLILKALALGLTSYGRLPLLYSGFVSTATVNAVKNIDGKFFHSVTPDVYSGIVLAGQLDSYYYSTRPFSLNGGSKYSNGQSSGGSNEKLEKLFFDEADMPMHKEYSIIAGSITSCVAEAFMQAQDRNLVRSFKLHKEKYYKLIYLDLISHPNLRIASGIKKLAEYKISSSLRNLVEKYELKNYSASKKLHDAATRATITSRDPLHNSGAAVACGSGRAARCLFAANSTAIGKENNAVDRPSPRDHRPQGVMQRVPSGIVLLASDFHVKNVYEASHLVATIIGKYIQPKLVRRAYLKEFLVTYFYRKLSKIFDGLILKF